jgi:hypothetical protein
MAGKDRIHRCLSPVGIQSAIETFPLAPRLDTIQGRTIYLSVCGEPDITLALEKRLKSSYPEVNWKTKRTYITDPVPLSDEEIKTCDGLIQGVAW